MHINSTIQTGSQLKAMLNLDQEELHGLVCGVMTGEIKEPCRYELRLGLTRLLNEERQAYNPAAEDAELKRQRCELLDLWVSSLSGPVPQPDDKTAALRKMKEIVLEGRPPMTVLISEILFLEFAATARFLNQCSPLERGCVQFWGTEGSLLANVPQWITRISADFPAQILRDEDARVIALFTVTRESPSIGSLGICAQADCPVNVLEKIINLAATLARSRFGVLQTAMPASRAGAASAFNNAGFEHTLMKGVQPDGAGGTEDRIIFYKRLRCDEEYSSAGD